MKNIAFVFILLTLFITSCEKEEELKVVDPDAAEIVSVDRFNEETGVLYIRNDLNNLPEANAAVDYDTFPGFLTKGLGPDGEKVEYYNFDVQPQNPAPIWLLFREGETEKVEEQLTILDAIPGDEGYSDFWQIYNVTVPANYKANSITSFQDIIDNKYPTETTNKVVNCPVVPKGSSAQKRYLPGEDNQIQRGWYKSKIVYYFSFEEKDLELTNDLVPLSDIFVCFNINPGEDNGGSGSGIKTEDDTNTGQSHSVVETIPLDEEYSPLWYVQVYNNVNFDNMANLDSAKNTEILMPDAMKVNCPLVYVE